MAKLSAVEMLSEIARLSERSVQAAACARQFIDTNPVITVLDVDGLAAIPAGHLFISDKPSDELVRALMAVRAADEEFDSLGARKRHDGGSVDEPTLHLASALSTL
jgi:hypothetical protein